MILGLATILACATLGMPGLNPLANPKGVCDGISPGEQRNKAVEYGTNNLALRRVLPFGHFVRGFNPGFLPALRLAEPHTSVSGLNRRAKTQKEAAMGAAITPKAYGLSVAMCDVLLLLQAGAVVLQGPEGLAIPILPASPEEAEAVARAFEGAATYVRGQFCVEVL